MLEPASVYVCIIMVGFVDLLVVSSNSARDLRLKTKTTLQQWTLPEFASMPSKQWLQVEVDNEIEMRQLMYSHPTSISSRLVRAD